MGSREFLCHRFESRRRGTYPETNPQFSSASLLSWRPIGATLCHYEPKQTVFSQGDCAATVFYIQEGALRLSVLSQQGKEATLSLLGLGDFLGEGCLASDQPVRLASATAPRSTFTTT